MFLRDDDTEARQVEKLTRISTVLAERIDRLEASRGSAWSMFQAAVALEQEVHVRTRELEQALADAIGDGLAADAAVASSEAQAEALWKLRESMSESERAEGIAAKHDVAVPVSAMPGFIDTAAQAV